MRRSGSYSQAAGRQKQSLCQTTFIVLLILSCLGLGFALYGAKQAHDDLYARYKEAEKKIQTLQQSVSISKVETVDLDTHNREVKTENERLNAHLQQANAELIEKDEFIKNLQDKLTSAEVQLTKAEQAVADTEAQMATLESIINTQKIDVAESQREIEIMGEKLEMMEEQMNRSPTTSIKKKPRSVIETDTTTTTIDSTTGDEEEEVEVEETATTDADADVSMQINLFPHLNSRSPHPAGKHKKQSSAQHHENDEESGLPQEEESGRDELNEIILNLEDGEKFMEEDEGFENEEAVRGLSNLEGGDDEEENDLSLH